MVVASTEAIGVNNFEEPLGGIALGLSIELVIEVVYLMVFSLLMVDSDVADSNFKLPVGFTLLFWSDKIGTVETAVEEVDVVFA